jgi:hypothetical protein
MIWLFQRDDRVVRLETSFDNTTEEYVVVIAWVERPLVTERFQDFGQFHARILALEHQLGADHWTQVGPPMFIPDGWRGP